jgi:hypothetical protein
MCSIRFTIMHVASRHCRPNPVPRLQVCNSRKYSLRHPPRLQNKASVNRSLFGLPCGAGTTHSCLIRRQQSQPPCPENKVIGFLHEKGSCTCVVLTRRLYLGMEIVDLGCSQRDNLSSHGLQIKRTTRAGRQPCLTLFLMH